MDFFQSFSVFSPYALVLLRVSVGIIFLVHGWQKFGLWKMQPSEQMSAQMLGILKTLSIVEPLVAFSLILGIYVQIGATATAVIMLGALYFKKAKWGKKFTGDGGWELDFILLVTSIAIILLG